MFQKIFQLILRARLDFYGYVYDFSVDYDATAVNYELNMCKYLMKKNNM